MTTNPTNSAGNPTTYVPSTDADHPMWSDPTYIVDIARLIGWVERAIEGPIEGLGESAFDDYCRLCSGTAYIIANKLTIQYLESQPDLPTEQLSPFVILNEGSEELKTICQKAGISEQTYWFLDQGWMKRCLIQHTIGLHAKRQSDRDVEVLDSRLDAFTHFLCDQFIQQPTDGDGEIS